MTKLLLGLFTGVLFGVLLQKGRVAKPDVILGQLLLRDWTVAKIMGAAIVVGALGVNTLALVGAVSLTIKPMLIAGVLGGAILFGVGMALLGYCPGTSVAACGEGRRDAIAGVLGMIVGAFGYVLAEPVVKPMKKALGDSGELRLPDITPLTTRGWMFAFAVVALATAALVALRRRGERPSRA